MAVLYNRSRKVIDMSLFPCLIQVQFQLHRSKLFVICIPGSLGNDQMAKVRQRHVVAPPWFLLERHLGAPTFTRKLCVSPDCCYGQWFSNLLINE